MPKRCKTQWINAITESWYGTAEILEGETRLVCLIEPPAVGSVLHLDFDADGKVVFKYNPNPKQEHKKRRRRKGIDSVGRAIDGKPQHYLFIQGIEISGPVVVTTVRRGCSLPTVATTLNWDPDPEPPGRWRQRCVGEWKVRIVDIERQTLWERLGR